jgi:hypothetical protein
VRRNCRDIGRNSDRGSQDEAYRYRLTQSVTQNGMTENQHGKD